MLSTRRLSPILLKTILASVAAMAPVSMHAASPQDVFTGVARIVAVGDAHGDYEQLVSVLKSAGLIDDTLQWTGGKTHLVQTGDLLDRGAEGRKCLDLLMSLEKQAQAAGGRLHALIGNHEAMNLYGDLRYVTPADFASYRDPKSDKPADGKNPPGYAEHRMHFAANGDYGKWIRGHNAVLKINNMLFVHGGIGPKYADMPVRTINDRVRAELNDFSKLEGGIVKDEEGPLWYRGMAQGDEKTLAPQVNVALKNFGVEHVAIGHTFTDGAVTPRFGGKVILIDVGLARVYDKLGRMACLVVEDGTPYALHRGKKMELPADAGPGLLSYLKQAAALDPSPSALEKRIATLEATLPAR